MLRAVDATFVKVHQHGANPIGGQQAHAIGRTKGGLNTKLHAAVDGAGKVVALVPTVGQVRELRIASELLAGLCDVIIIADKAYDIESGEPVACRQMPHRFSPIARQEAFLVRSGTELLAQESDISRLRIEALAGGDDVLESLAPGLWEATTKPCANPRNEEGSSLPSFISMRQSGCAADMEQVTITVV